MKIDSIQIQNTYGAYAGGASDASGENGRRRAGAALDDELGAAQQDRVELSSQAVHMADAQKMAPKVTGDDDGASREAKVAQLRSLVESGQYSVSSKDVARSILVGTFYDREA